MISWHPPWITNQSLQKHLGNLLASSPVVEIPGEHKIVQRNYVYQFLSKKICGQFELPFLQVISRDIFYFGVWRSKNMCT